VPDVRIRIQQLADSLRVKCGIRLTTWRHGAQSWIRGAYLDSLESPLNDYRWYMLHFMKIAALSDEAARLKAIRDLITRTDPGEGGFYDWLGDLDTFAKRVVCEKTWDEDPGYLRTPVICHEPYSIQMRMNRTKNWYDEIPITLRWVASARAIYGTPLKLKYNGLDPKSRYRMRASYPALLLTRYLNLTGYELHISAGNKLIHSSQLPSVDPENPIVEYDLPPESYADGNLTLTWQMKGTLYPINIGEVWIIKQ
jgi:hypothetical protein